MCMYVYCSFWIVFLGSKSISNLISYVLIDVGFLALLFLCLGFYEMYVLLESMWLLLTPELNLWEATAISRYSFLLDLVKLLADIEHFPLHFYDWWYSAIIHLILIESFECVCFLMWVFLWKEIKKTLIRLLLCVFWMFTGLLILFAHSRRIWLAESFSFLKNVVQGFIYNLQGFEHIWLRYSNGHRNAAFSSNLLTLSSTLLFWFILKLLSTVQSL